VVIGLAFWLKPRPEDLRAAVEASVAAYAADKLAPVHTITEARDYLVAASYVAKLENGHEFYCIGAMKVTVCQTPD
jgi:hypothetical protein